MQNKNSLLCIHISEGPPSKEQDTDVKGMFVKQSTTGLPEGARTGGEQVKSIGAGPTMTGVCVCVCVVHLNIFSTEH